jgi:F-type H+-transporting ATPase subunit epsilon
MANIKLEVITPKGAVLDTSADWVSAPGVEGEFGVLPEHRPALVALGGGAVRYGGPQGEGSVFIRGGLAEVGPDRVLVLADEAVLPGEENRGAAETLLSRVEGELTTQTYLDDEALNRLGTDRAFAEIQLARH